MKTLSIPSFGILLLLAPLLAGCTSGTKSIKEAALDDYYPILSAEQYGALQGLSGDEEVRQFLDSLWVGIEASPDSGAAGLKTEYLRRLEYANTHFPDRWGWGRSDRKRIYLTYGPPQSIDRFQFTDVQFGKFSTLKAIEIWLYYEPGKSVSFPSVGDVVYPGQKRFIFADATGSGVYSLLFSSEDASDDDLRWLKQP